MVQDRHQWQGALAACFPTPLDIIPRSLPTYIYQRKRAGTVGILNDFERRLEGAVEGIFAKVFRTGLHPVSRSVFRPPPNVNSALVAFRRVGLPDDFALVKKVVAGAFAHRRKTLPNSLELSGIASRERAVAALAAIGRDATVRAEALAPPEFVELTRALT